MSMGRRGKVHQEALWLESKALATGPGHPFYDKLNEILKGNGFDEFVEDLCKIMYIAGVGRPSIPPGVYFRLLMIGYFEGIDSERGICWRVADSLGLRRFLGYDLAERTPDHSSLSRIRCRLPLHTHQVVFEWVLTLLAKEKLLKGKTIGVDATTLEANAALRSIVRRDTGESYLDFLTRLAQASGIENPTREDLARVDRKRAHKGSNKEWRHPFDPDAAIAKMKDGRTHLAHKAEHAVDMETGAVVAVNLMGADLGDTETMPWTLIDAKQNLEQVAADPEAKEHLNDQLVEEAVADKGYHSNDTLVSLKEDGVRSYISEPDRGPRHWKDKAPAQRATYANRRRIRGARGQRLRKKRGELIERTFAHAYETGAMRRTHLRGHENILKRLLTHVSGLNLGLLMRRSFGIGTPRSLQGLLFSLFQLFLVALRTLHHGAPRPRGGPGVNDWRAGPFAAIFVTAANHRSSTDC